MPQYVMLAAMALVFYFFMIKPQYDKQKKQKAFLNSLKKGVKIVTTGGVHGVIYDVKNNIIVLEINEDGTKITINKEAISHEIPTEPVQEKKQ